MTVNDTLINVFSKLYTFRLVLFECITSKDENHTKFVIVIEFLGEQIRLRYDDENFNVIESYFIDNPQSAEEKLRLILKSNTLKVFSIAYILKNEYEDTMIEAFSEDEILSYRFFSIRDINYTDFNYEIYVEIDKVCIPELIEDFTVFIEMLRKEKPKKIIRIINDPILDFRMKKLKELDIFDTI